MFGSDFCTSSVAATKGMLHAIQLKALKKVKRESLELQDYLSVHNQITCQSHSDESSDIAQE